MGQKPSKVHITETDKAILQLKRSKDEIHKYTKKSDRLIAIEKDRLKQLIHDNPKTYKKDTKVRFLLKKIHYQEHLLQQASDQLINLENMVSTLEFKMVEKEFVSGLQTGNEILKKLNAEFKDVDKLMDDVQDQIEYQAEVDNALANSVVGTNTFEDELDRELDQLDKEVNGLPELPTTEGLPAFDNRQKEKNEVERINNPQQNTEIQGKKEEALPA
ncbi:hypothetical protein B1J92_D04246g [Nakaseomyces glabratus]|nr:hypothetical protein B1J91_D04246g [Nakaseomyces glabratus]OXB50009.1 hypothetical protein B1J92_D04246g [Nakaseomyces glabratus]